jgi:hypothetical protein
MRAPAHALTAQYNLRILLISHYYYYHYYYYHYYYYYYYYCYYYCYYYYCYSHSLLQSVMVQDTP